MSQPFRLVWLCCVVVLCWVAVARSKAAEAASPPNILLIVADDLGYGDVSSLGNPFLRTPHIDRLRSEGMHLRNYYTAPLCAPARAQLMTGRDNLRTGIWDTWKGRSNMAADERTLPEYLGAAGYATGFFGKWHLGLNYPFRPQEQGFQRTVFPINNPQNYDRFEPIFEKDGVTIDGTGRQVEDVSVEEAIAFMREAGNRPFFCYVPFYYPHLSYLPTLEQKYWDQFPASTGLSERVRGIYGMIAKLDECVGRLLQFLDDEQRERSTVVIFVSDNGHQLTTEGEVRRFVAGLRGGKGSVWEGGLKVPAFVRWPGRIPAGSTLPARVAAIDLLPTVLALAGLPPAEGIDGVNLRPALLDGVNSIAERYLFQQQQPQKTGQTPQPYENAAVIGSDFKLVFPSAKTAPMLFDLRVDEGERRDVAARHPDQVARMKAAYDAWWQTIVTGRGFAPLHAVVGHPAQTITDLSMLHFSDDHGFPIEVERAGEYTLQISGIQTRLFPGGGELGFMIGDRVWKFSVQPGMEEIQLPIRLERGRTALVPYARGMTASTEFYNTRDLGFREMKLLSAVRAPASTTNDER